MKDGGLEEVSNPSELFLAERPQRSTGSVVVRVWRHAADPRGTAKPWCPGRISHAKANGQRRGNQPSLAAAGGDGKSLGMHLSGRMSGTWSAGFISMNRRLIWYRNAAVTSSLRECPIDFTTLVMGEVGLGGEVRAISQAELRIREARKDGVQTLPLAGTKRGEVRPSRGH